MITRTETPTTKSLYFFTRVPCGSGLSFCKRVFEPNFSPEQMYEFQGLTNFIRTDHSNHALIDGHFQFGLHMLLPFREPKYLIMLREPIDRTVSDYYHARHPSTEGYRHPDWALTNSLSLSEYGKLARFRNVQTQFMAGMLPSALNQFSSVLYKPQVMLKQALQNLERFYCFAGTMERFDECVELFSRQENLPASPPMAKRANANRKSLSELDERTLRDLREYNALDLELYEYAAELLNRKLLALREPETRQ